MAGSATRKRRLRPAPPVRYAVVGLGYIAQTAVLPAFAHARRNSRLTALVSDDPEKLRRLGFAPADLPVRVPALQSIGHQVLLVPFAHPEESAIFLMGIESRLPRTELMLHIVTPLKNGRRVETSTLAALRHLRPPEAVDVRVVTDAESIDEIWSHHRRALMAYERAERQAIDPEGWKVPIAQAYDAWVQAAIRSRRIQLSRDGATYQLRRGE